MYHADQFIIDIDLGLDTERRAVFATREEVDDYVFDRLASNDAKLIQINEFDPTTGTWELDATIKPEHDHALWIEGDRVFLYSKEEA